MLDLARELGLLPSSEPPSLSASQSSWLLPLASCDSPPPQHSQMDGCQQASGTEQWMLGRLSCRLDLPAEEQSAQMEEAPSCRPAKPALQGQPAAACAAHGLVHMVTAGAVMHRPTQQRQPSPPEQQSPTADTSGLTATPPVSPAPAGEEPPVRMPLPQPQQAQLQRQASQQARPPSPKRQQHQQERNKGQQAQPEREQKQKQRQQEQQGQPKQKRAEEPREEQGPSPKRQRPAAASPRPASESPPARQLPSPVAQLPPASELAAALLDELSRQSSVRREEEEAAAAWHHQQRRLLEEAHAEQRRQLELAQQAQLLQLERAQLLGPQSLSAALWRSQSEPLPPAPGQPPAQARQAPPSHPPEQQHQPSPAQDPEPPLLLRTLSVEQQREDQQAWQRAEHKLWAAAAAFLIARGCRGEQR